MHSGGARSEVQTASHSKKVRSLPWRPRLRSVNQLSLRASLFFEKKGITTPFWVPFLRAFPVRRRTAVRSRDSESQARPAGHVKFDVAEQIHKRISSLRG